MKSSDVLDFREQGEPMQNMPSLTQRQSPRSRQAFLLKRLLPFQSLVSLPTKPSMNIFRFKKDRPYLYKQLPAEWDILPYSLPSSTEPMFTEQPRRETETSLRHWE